MVGHPWKERTFLVQGTGQLPPYETYRVLHARFQLSSFCDPSVKLYGQPHTALVSNILL